MRRNKKVKNAIFFNTNFSELKFKRYVLQIVRRVYFEILGVKGFKRVRFLLQLRDEFV